MKDLIFEALVGEACDRVRSQIRNGSSLDESLAQVSEDMALDQKEIQEVSARIKKAPRPKKIEEISEPLDITEPADPISQPTSNTIYFDSPEEMETAMGVLMYKGIAWDIKGENSLTFSGSDQLQKAQDSLNRRWNFINSQPRVVATIQFDNLQDYNKVVDFMGSKNMGVVLGDGGEFEGDLDFELAEAETNYKKAKKEAKLAGLPEPEAPRYEMSYRALHKDSQLRLEDLNVMSDPKARSLHVVKRWK